MAIAFLALIILIVVWPRVFVFDSFSKRVSWGDDILNVNVADSLRDGDGLTEDIVTYRDVVSPEYNWGPPYAYYHTHDSVSRAAQQYGPLHWLYLSAVFTI